MRRAPQGLKRGLAHVHTVHTCVQVVFEIKNLDEVLGRGFDLALIGFVRVHTCLQIVVNWLVQSRGTDICSDFIP